MTESAELSKTKRIKHLYPRQEVYHRFVHSPEYAYSPSSSIQVSCRGNYLFTWDYGRTNDLKDIEGNYWQYSKSKIIAIINRELKCIMINTKHEEHIWDLRQAIPDNYTVYYTNKDISDKNILLNTERCLKLHSEYLIKQFVDNALVYPYAIINGEKTNLHFDINNEHCYISRYRNEIVKFVKENKIKKYNFYKECFDESYTFRIPLSYSRSKRCLIKLPTLQQIVNNTYFTKKEKLLLEQRLFWTKYCFGNNISFKDVVANWNKEVQKEEVIKYLGKRICVYENTISDKDIWNDYVKEAVELERERDKAYINESYRKSDENYKAAVAKLHALTESVKFGINEWREGQRGKTYSVPYRKFTRVPGTKQMHWIDATVNKPNNYIFDNIQLRLNPNKTTIITSNYASVPLEEGIKMYKMFVKARTNTPDKTTWTSYDFNDVRVGIYNLRFVTYKEKVTDKGKKLGYKEWLIQIGCHSIWLDDVMNFIHYYHLEKEFGLE